MRVVLGIGGRKEGTLGKVTNYFIRCEFQQRGSPHYHCLIYVENKPQICALDLVSSEGMTSELSSSIADYVDAYTTCHLATDEECPDLAALIPLQTHRCMSRYCKKRKIGMEDNPTSADSGSPRALNPQRLFRIRQKARMVTTFGEVPLKSPYISAERQRRNGSMRTMRPS